MFPWMMGYPYPYPQQEHKEQDPLRMLRKFEKFLNKEQAKKKEGEKKKEVSSITLKQVNQVALLLLVTMPITGPLYLICMALMWHAVKASLN